MNKNHFTLPISIAIFLVIVFFALIFINNKNTEKDLGTNVNTGIDVSEAHKNIKFIIDGAEADTKYFGNEITIDLNKDLLDDKVFIVTHSPGGSGTFYYAVGAIATGNSDAPYIATSPLLLGDRIAPQTTEPGQTMADGIKTVVINYADRKIGEPMTTQPSVGKSLVLKLDPKTNQFGEVVQNFEGEADPKKMSLTMKSWQWVSATYSDGKKLSPKKPETFIITFNTDKTFSVKTDCNNIGGSFKENGGTIAFENMMSTLMFCPDSQEADFSKILTETQSYFFTSKGELVFDFKFDSGSAVFK